MCVAFGELRLHCQSHLGYWDPPAELKWAAPIGQNLERLREAALIRIGRKIYFGPWWLRTMDLVDSVIAWLADSRLFNNVYFRRDKVLIFNLLGLSQGDGWPVDDIFWRRRCHVSSDTSTGIGNVRRSQDLDEVTRWSGEKSGGRASSIVYCSASWKRDSLIASLSTAINHKWTITHLPSSQALRLLKVFIKSYLPIHPLSYLYTLTDLLCPRLEVKL